MASGTTLPHLMDLPEVAETLNLSPHTIRAWVREGRIQPVRLCRRLLFHPAEVQRLIDTAMARQD
jgi:excisionase family DNA binding protein